MERAYDLGATDFIRRPFDATVVRCRVQNTLMLSERQHSLMTIVSDQIREKKRDNELMVSILSNIVEAHNGESGMHVLHIGIITELLLRCLSQKTGRYDLSRGEISLIVTASALHDIGKITVPDSILNKPGELTAEERKCMEGHALAGAQMLETLGKLQEEPLVQTAYEICRWHHERFDGCGYPDGLKGDEIPISAQAVSMADVYDALTSKRCYKDAIPHDEAMDMILGGQCGAFNPLLLDCLKETGDAIHQALTEDAPHTDDTHDMAQVAMRLQTSGLSASDHLLQQLDVERQQFQFLYENSQEPLFWYTVSPSLLNINDACRRIFGLNRTTFDPKQDEQFLRLLGADPVRAVLDQVYNTTPEHPETYIDLQLNVGGRNRPFRCFCCTIWAPGSDGRYSGVVGRLVDTERERNMRKALTDQRLRRASDLIQNGVCAMTGLEAQVALEYLGVVFDIVRLVDVDNCRTVDPEHTDHCQSGNCFD
jgi:putative two-component system response regulator